MVRNSIRPWFCVRVGFHVMGPQGGYLGDIVNIFILISEVFGFTWYLVYWYGYMSIWISAYLWMHGHTLELHMFFAAQTWILGRCLCSLTSPSTNLNKKCIWVKKVSVFLFWAPTSCITSQKGSLYDDDIFLVKGVYLSVLYKFFQGGMTLK